MGRRRLGIGLIALLPLLLFAAYLRIELASASRIDSQGTSAGREVHPGRECEFPGPAEKRSRLVIAFIDSLRDETAFDPEMMPWLATQGEHSLHGRMTPCLSQLSLLCFRTMFEGAEPLLVTGLANFSGMRSEAPNLIQALADRGVRIAAVGDRAFIRLYGDFWTESATLGDRPPAFETRDDYTRERTFAWLDEPTLDVIISLTLDADAVAHRSRVGSPAYVAKFRETDDFLREVHERLGPRDYLIVTSDHGHDEQGYHSTGIFAPTVYFAWGPDFPAGRRIDLDMSAISVVLAAATCEKIPSGYTGKVPSGLVASPGGQDGADASDATQIAGAGSSGHRSRAVLWPALLISTAAFVWLLGRATDPLTPAGRVALVGNLATLGAAIAVPYVLVLWLNAAANLALVRFRSALARVSEWLPWVAMGVALAFGTVAHVVLVTLQNHVNPVWTMGFWVVLVLTILACARGLQRIVAVSFGRATGLAAWGVIFYGLFVGPYYYGTARNLLFGLTWLLLACVLSMPRPVSRALWRWVALALLPMIPLHAPIMKEWQLRYIPLTFAADLGAVALVAVVVGLVVVAVLLTPSRGCWRRAGPIVAAIVGLGLATDLAGPPLLGAVLLTISYVGWTECAALLGRGDDVGPGARWLVPIGQASYAFMAYFVLLLGIRFANVDFKFALDLVPVEAGEAVGAAVATPLTVVKYCGPVALLLAAGSRLGAKGLALLLLKAACMVAAFAGMDLVAHRAVTLFAALQAQEILLVIFPYATAVVAFLAGIGRKRESLA